MSQVSLSPFPTTGLQPSRYRHLAATGGVALPWGGPLNTNGNPFVQGAPLTLIGGNPQAEIWSLSLNGAGTFNFQFVADATYSTGFLNAATVTAAQLLAALNTIWPSWALPAGSVTGSVGAGFTITFGGSSGFGSSGNYARVGGTVTFNTTGTANATLTRTQRGSVGAGQYDFTDGVVNTQASAFLEYTYPLGPTGALQTVPYGGPNDTTFTPTAWIQGYFFGAPLLAAGLTDAIVAASPTKLTYYLGSALENTGSEVYLSQ